MAEQQLVDYIKKAKDAGQTDSQTRDLLYKNGWTEAEVNEAFSALSQPKPQPQAQPQAAQPRPQPQQAQPQIQSQPQMQARPQPQAQPQTTIQPKPQIQTQAVDLTKVKLSPEELSQQTAVQPQVSAQPQAQPQIQSQPQMQARPQPQAQPQIVKQPEPQYKPQVSKEMNMPQMRGKSHFVLKALIVLIIVAILGGSGYFVAGQYIVLPWNPLQNFSLDQILSFSWNPFKAMSPESVVSNMTANMKNVKSSHSTIQAEVNVADTVTKTSQGKLVFSANTEMDSTDANNLKSDGNFTINLTTQTLPVPATATISTISDGGISYIKLNNISLPAGTPYSGLDTAKITGKWLKIDQDSIKALSQTASNEEMLGALNLLPQQINTANTADSLDLAKKIQNLIIAENLVSVVKQLGDETISGQSTYHYLAVIDSAKLKDLIGKVIALSPQATISQSGANPTDNNSGLLAQNMVQAAANTIIDSIGDINFEIWIGKRDYLLYQVKMDKTIDIAKITGSTGPQVGIKFTMTNSNFGKTITVQAPADVQKIETAILPLIKAGEIGSDISQIKTIAQSLFFLNKSYYSLCSRGLLNGYAQTYGTKLISLNNDIVKQGAKKPSCFADVQDFCVSAEMADGSYMCVDKTKLGTTKCVNAKTVCQ